MEPEYKTIYEFDNNLLYEYYINLERQGPGSPEMTIKALSFIDNLNDTSHIADIGCGTGGQTLVLAKYTTGNIIGIDLSPTFIEKLNTNINKNNLQNRVKGIVESMESLSLEAESLDMIWSEGAIYNIGFGRGMKEWNKYLKKDGYIAVTDASWFTEERPAEITEFWKVYPEMDTIPNNISKMQKAGYIPIASFVFPEICWTENFFKPAVSVQKIFLEKYSGNKDVEDFIFSERYEAQLYEKYKEYYGYVFYIGKKYE
jgi:SAM-dependent methyltransferase